MEGRGRGSLSSRRRLLKLEEKRREVFNLQRSPLASLFVSQDCSKDVLHSRKLVQGNGEREGASESKGKERKGKERKGKERKEETCCAIIPKKKKNLKSE